MEKQPTNILILGNGFDLNFGLKTGYCDFVKSEQFLKLKNFGSELANYLHEQNDLNNWIDIENELTACSHNQLGNLEKEYDDVCAALMNYLEQIHYPKDQWPTARAYDLFEAYQNKEFLVIDFNYTPTSRLLLQHFGKSDQQIDDILIKIHGSTAARNIIFGVEDSAKIKRQHVFLKKSFNKNFSPRDFKKMFQGAESLAFFGHSLGITDFMYFKDFFSNATFSNKRKDLIIFHYGKQGYLDLHMQLDDMTNNRLSALKQSNTVTFIDSVLG
ncbi:Bacteriophage abortive infection AbiH [Pedobacter antarcticus]|nr:AbiH family protein [Pedobacter antarcticus]SFF46889.1 Bacteriophage abortive infection AbiH [Pedobacter antarcticus]